MVYSFYYVIWPNLKCNNNEYPDSSSPVDINIDCRFSPESRHCVMKRKLVRGHPVEILGRTYQPFLRTFLVLCTKFVYINPFPNGKI